MIDLAWSATEATLSSLEDTVQAERAEATRYLDQVAASDVLDGIVTVPVVAEGSPGRAILTEAKDRLADVIVICSHGDTRLKRWLLGSVAQKVARYSPVPVLVLREGAGIPTNQHPEGTRSVRVLVPLDGSPLAENVLIPAAHLSAALSAPLPAELHLVQILPYTQVSRGIPFDEKRDETTEAEAYLKQVEQRLSEGKLAELPVPIQISAFVAVASDIAGMIIDTAEGKASSTPDHYVDPCDIIAMATHGRSGLSHWLLGSMTERVLSTTRMPLFILRPPAVTTEAVQQQKTTHGSAEKNEVTATTWAGLL
jgi:nucleotide-binding universal stress UspA family protein